MNTTVWNCHGFGNPQAILIFVTTLSLCACASKSAYTGHEATDLSIVRKGTPRVTIEAVLGQPEKTELKNDALLAWYVYDRGFVGNLEAISATEKVLWVPVMAFGEVVSLGLAGWMIACQAPCQKGLLMVQYDQKEQVSGVEESFLPDDHPLVASCANSAVRGNLAVCEGVRENVRSSSMPQLDQH